jgi:prepilin-type N-terminal cleavage/methylation domain-containing protein
MPVESRRGFTLIEVMLVLAIVVIIAGLSWTAMQGPMARWRLLRAADDVRREWVVARDDAMQSGHTYIFRYRIHGDRYRLGPQEEDSSIADASAANAATTTSPGSATASPGSSTVAQPSSVSEGDSSDEPLPPPVDGALPKGVRFLSENAVSDLAAMGDKPADAAGDEGTWSDPIYFWADGCTSDARISLAADRHATVRLQLRGVTGSVSVDDLTSRP